MERRPALVFLHHRDNRYSFHALAGALEGDPFTRSLPRSFPVTLRAFAAELSRLARDHRAVLAGISFATPRAERTRRVVAALRRHLPGNVLFLAGGPHPTGDPVGTIRVGFDLAVVGEGEETLPELARALSEGRPLGEVSGLAIRGEDGAGILTPRRPPVDLDRHPPFGFDHSKFGPLEITRGCPFACAYCQTTSLCGARPRHRSLPVIRHWARELVRRGLPDLRFISPNALSWGSAEGRTVELAALSALLSALRQDHGRNARIFFGTFPSEVRPEHVTPDTIRLLRHLTDNRALVLGCQSGSQRVLDRCRRGHTVDDVRRAVELTREAGMEPQVDFILGLPGEEEEDLRLTLAAMAELADRGARIRGHTFLPLPGSGFAREAPGRVDPRAADLLGRLTARGQGLGRWREQEGLGGRIRRVLDEGTR